MTAIAMRALDGLLRDIAASAAEVDQQGYPPTRHLPAIARTGLLDAGVDDLLHGRAGATDVRVPAETIAAIAEECLPTAFAVWAHRSVLDYLARGDRSPRTDALLAELRRAERVGSTGMAAGIKALAGVGDLGVEARRADGGWVFDGAVSWASNLVERGVVVLTARTPDGSVVAWVPLDAAGLGIRPAAGLLAMDATASGRIVFDGVRVEDDQVISTDLAAFARAFRPPLLVLQTALCVGLARRSLAESERALDASSNAVFADDVRGLRQDADRLLATWERLAADVTAAPAREFLQLRLAASHLAQTSTRLELTLAGGRGYLVASGANRRFREAAFLPVQSPSEGQLRWELCAPTPPTPA